jgi:predicted RecA/RadA family phage recombinase
MKNQTFQGTPTSPRFALCPITVKSGDLVLVGAEPACALNDYQSNSGGAAFYFSGTFSGTVHGSSTHSPYTPAAINVGDKLFATGTLDSATNVTTGLTITSASGDAAFGFLDPTGPSILSGATVTTAQIRLSVG